MTPKPFSEVMAEDRRMHILRYLARDPGYSLNIFMLRNGLDLVAHEVSLDCLKGDAAWLEEQGLITTEILANEMLILTLTQRGLDIAQDRAHHPGIKRPAPGL